MLALLPAWGPASTSAKATADRSAGPSWEIPLVVRSSSFVLSVIVLIGVSLAHVASGVVDAQTPTFDPDSVAAGMRIFRTKGDCQSCHGWAADGRKMDSQMPDGANLRTTRLTRDKLIVAIKCGVPGKGMPAFDRLAYSDGRCYGMKQADLQRANLEGASLFATIIEGADLRGANLSGTRVIGYLRSAKLAGAIMRDANMGADPSNQSMGVMRATFVGADLTGADLTGTNLYKADLSHATLAKARLVRATLSNAELVQTDLTHADLTGAKLDKADLDGADFTGAVGLDQVQGLAQARNRDKATFDAK